MDRRSGLRVRSRLDWCASHYVLHRRDPLLSAHRRRPRYRSQSTPDSQWTAQRPRQHPRHHHRHPRRPTPPGSTRAGRRRVTRRARQSPTGPEVGTRLRRRPSTRSTRPAPDRATTIHGTLHNGSPTRRRRRTDALPPQHDRPLTLHQRPAGVSHYPNPNLLPTPHRRVAHPSNWGSRLPQPTRRSVLSFSGKHTANPDRQTASHFRLNPNPDFKRSHKCGASHDESGSGAVYLASQ